MSDNYARRIRRHKGTQDEGGTAARKEAHDGSQDQMDRDGGTAPDHGADGVRHDDGSDARDDGAGGRDGGAGRGHVRGVAEAPEGVATEAFAAHVARREAERAQEVKVTWRRVSDDTGGGWSGLGPDGLLVYVMKASHGERPACWEYGRLEGTERVMGGHRYGRDEAKRAAELLMRRMVGAAPYQQETACSPTDGTTSTRVPSGTQKGTEMSIESTLAPTAESLMDGIGECVANEKATYCRMIVNGKAIGYANPRKDGVVLDFAAKAVEGAPKRFKLETKGSRALLKVTVRNVKGARELLQWIAEQTAPAASA